MHPFPEHTYQLINTPRRVSTFEVRSKRILDRKITVFFFKIFIITWQANKLVGGHVASGLVVAVDQCWVGAVAQQQGADLDAVLRGGLVQRGELPQVHRVHLRPVLYQQFGHLGIETGFWECKVKNKNNVKICPGSIKILKI